MSRLKIRQKMLVFLVGVAVLPQLLAESHHGGAAHQNEHGPNHLSVFLGGTDVDEEGTGFTLGLDYEYRVSRLLGVGAVVEYAFDDIDATTVLAVADLHLRNGLIIQVGPGYEFNEHKDVFVTRMGALYEFERGAITISPQIHFDVHFDAKDAFVIGIAIGRAF